MKKVETPLFEFALESESVLAKHINLVLSLQSPSFAVTVVQPVEQALSVQVLIVIDPFLVQVTVS